MNRYPALALGSTLLLATNSVHASDRIKPLFQAAYESGGDDLVTLYYTDGSDETIEAGGGLLLGAGVAIQTLSGNEHLHTQLTLNWKTDSTSEADGEMDWNLFPLELIQFYSLEKIRAGIGLTYHMAPSLEGSGILSSLNVDFDNALGAVFQLDYQLNHSLFLGIRVTSIEYEVSDTGATRDGSNIGIVLGAMR